ncbi:DUF4147 domain-containing protein [Patescibacteria group bacterium]|nr:DUF4147 domain-containing protein [Patescibacteria group bacterium]MCL5010573.1 DUF4147 domain-containing protein [Patescibacteria group bacterium]
MPGIIKNFSELAKTQNRKIVLELIESALASIEPHSVLDKSIMLRKNTLAIEGKQIDLRLFDKIILIGFGKGSAGLAKIIEEKLGDFLKEGYVIDTNEEKFARIEFTKGGHPLPSKTNYEFTKKVKEKCKNLSAKTLVLLVIAGGGSSMFVDPAKISLGRLVEINKALLKANATIFEMNTIRKHLSLVKGGGLARILYPARVLSLIFSDVPGNDLSVIASGPTVKDPTTIENALKTAKKLGLSAKLTAGDLIETPKDDRYFMNVSNLLLLSNLTALEAMKKKAHELGFEAQIYSDRFQSEARYAGRKLIEKANPGKILLVGGETTVKVMGSGTGGRNQELVLGSLPFLKDNMVIASFDSDGWDNSPPAGAIADHLTIKKMKKLTLDPALFLNNNNSMEFFNKTGDLVITGRLPSNVSDLMIVLN